MIDVQNLIYDYPGLRALDNVSFGLAPRSITALVGPNGAGKTTLLRCMAALEEPMSGVITLNGADVWKQPREAHRHMGYLPDHFGLYQELTAERCLLYAAYAHGLDEEQASAATQWAARETGLEQLLRKRAGALSRGQRQRLALAQAIVHKPQLLLLDEPASGLDPQARATLASLMKSLAAQGMTLLISSHILAELETYCSAMLVLEKGRIKAHVQLQDMAAVAASPQQCSRRRLFLRLAASADTAGQIQKLHAWFSEKDVTVLPGSRPDAMFLEALLDDAMQAALLQALLQTGLPVTEFSQQQQTLQDAYMQTLGN